MARKAIAITGSIDLKVWGGEVVWGSNMSWLRQCYAEYKRRLMRCVVRKPEQVPPCRMETWERSESKQLPASYPQEAALYMMDQKERWYDKWQQGPRAGSPR